MSATKRHSVVESVFDRNQRREAEINEALKQEAAPPCGCRQEHAALEGAASCERREEQGTAAYEDNCSTPTTGGGLTINGKHNVNFR
jgi:hypothetical protein